MPALLALSAAQTILPACLAIHFASAPEDVGSMWLWVATLAMAVVMSAVAFKNAKRSHQD